LNSIKILDASVKIVQCTRPDGSIYSKVSNEHEGKIRLADFNGTISDAKHLFAPNGIAQKNCIAWMESYFRVLGDNDPTSENVHLEQQQKSEIYEEYKEEMLATSKLLVYVH
jgi:hypothetical protein